MGGIILFASGRATGSCENNLGGKTTEELIVLLENSSYVPDVKVPRQMNLVHCE